MKLYYAPGACSLAPHIVAREAGVALDLVKVDLAKHRLETGEDLSRVNAKNYVPAIELDDGQVLTEAAALVQWLAEQAPQSGLLPPAGTLERFRVQE
jgi:glutathione S-transferase